MVAVPVPTSRPTPPRRTALDRPSHEYAAAHDEVGTTGVDKDASLTEHREALERVTEAVAPLDAEPLQASGAVDWLLFDWVMAHRESPDSASATVRARFDLGLLDLPT